VKLVEPSTVIDVEVRWALGATAVAAITCAQIAGGNTSSFNFPQAQLDGEMKCWNPSIRLT
jgi:hypothetical protein